MSRPPTRSSGLEHEDVAVAQLPGGGQAGDASAHHHDLCPGTAPWGQSSATLMKPSTSTRLWPAVPAFTIVIVWSGSFGPANQARANAIRR